MFRVEELAGLYYIYNAEAQDYMRAADGSIWYSRSRERAEGIAARYNSRVIVPGGR